MDKILQIAHDYLITTQLGVSSIADSVTINGNNIDYNFTNTKDRSDWLTASIDETGLLHIVKYTEYVPDIEYALFCNYIDALQEQVNLIIDMEDYPCDNDNKERG